MFMKSFRSEKTLYSHLIKIMLCFGFWGSGVVLAAETTGLKDLDRRYMYYRASYLVNEDYTQEQRRSWAVKILNERAIKELKSTAVSFSTSVEKVEVLEAYNQKADGRKVEAPKTNYQVQTNTGMNDKSPLFSDRTKVTTVFPDVAVGDTLVFSYKRTISEPMFPNYFAESESFSEGVAYDEARIDLTVPKSFKGLYKVRGMNEKILKKDKQVVYQWDWKNLKPSLSSRQDYSVWDMESNPGFAYTTFSSYKAIAEAYGVRALPKVALTDDIKNLAAKIVGQATDKKEQAKLIYEWVSRNISYAGNCVGVGAVVPHDAKFILDNRMGDCKDHATLLQSLLAVQGIKSTQALINSGTVYKLPSIPAVNSVNHVINYLPEFDLFVDSTSEITPFGSLPRSIQGKPVLLVEGFIDGLKTPVTPVGRNKQTTVTELIFQPDGSVKGSVVIVLSGEPAINARSGWRNVSADAEENWLKNLFTQNGRKGSASIEKDDPKPLIDTFSYTIKFEEKEALMTDSAGGMHIYPPLPLYDSIANLTQVSGELETHDVACNSAASEENYSYHFPKQFKILDVPKDMHIEGSYLAYSAFYKLEENTLTVSRRFEDKTPTAICSPDLMRSQREILQKINRNLKNQIIYKPLIEE